MGAEVRLREAPQFLIRQAFLGTEEAEVDGALAQPVKVIEQPLFVIGADGANANGAPVFENDFHIVSTRIHGHRPTPFFSARLN
jgi:hypothetical protein